MSDVVRLVTVVDIDDRAAAADASGAEVGDSPLPGSAEPGWAPSGSVAPIDDCREMAFTALHLAVLRDGRRLTLLDDRGWGVSGPPDIWQYTSAEEIAVDARTVVGPDEPFGARTQQDMEADHWSRLTDRLRRRGVAVGAEELRRLPHDVELSERVRARLQEHGAGGADPDPS